jgi:hypothetical protein
MLKYKSECTPQPEPLLVTSVTRGKDGCNNSTLAEIVWRAARQHMKLGDGNRYPATHEVAINGQQKFW